MIGHSDIYREEHARAARARARAEADAWPEGVVARHLTWMGEHFGDFELTVDVSETASRVRAVCRQCGGSFGEIPQHRAEVSDWARIHAVGCRALPRPGVA